MLYFPQLSQFPFQRQRKFRTVVNEARDGTQYKSIGPAGCELQWELPLVALNNAERDEVINTWNVCRGRAIPFTFIDPAANLFVWSEAFDKADWTKDPGVQAIGQSLTNSGQSTGRLLQWLNAPARFHYCLTFRIRGAAPLPLAAVCRWSEQERLAPFNVTDGWQRITFNSALDTGADQIAFGVELPPGASVELVEMQVQAQKGNSTYKPTTTHNGIYRSARFAMDDLRISENNVNDSSVTIRIIAKDL